MTPTEFKERVETELGAVIVYYAGSDLCESPYSFALANMAWALAVEGKVYLVQRRRVDVNGKNGFEYLAVVPSEGSVPRKFRACHPVK